MNKFSQRLKELRLNKGDTQKIIADYLGIIPHAYQKYEYGEREPNIDKLIAIAEYFDVSLDWLVGRSETQARQP